MAWSGYILDLVAVAGFELGPAWAHGYECAPENLEAAVAVAARVPQARMGGAVEVGPSVTYW
jgi:hypothetical protein